MYALKLIDKKIGLATCENCGNIFIKSRANKDWCSDNCGNNFRVKKHEKMLYAFMKKAYH